MQLIIYVEAPYLIDRHLLVFAVAELVTALWYGGCAVAAGAGAVVLAPVAISAVGFTGAGIAAGSYAAGMMSASAVASGGGVVAGSAVAVAQSIGKIHRHRHGLSWYIHVHVIHGAVNSLFRRRYTQMQFYWTKMLGFCLRLCCSLFQSFELAIF